VPIRAALRLAAAFGADGLPSRPGVLLRNDGLMSEGRSCEPRRGETHRNDETQNNDAEHDVGLARDPAHDAAVRSTAVDSIVRTSVSVQ